MQQPADSFRRAVHSREPGSSGSDHKIHKLPTITPSQNCALNLQDVVGDDVCVRDSPLLIALDGESVRQQAATAVSGRIMESCIRDNQDGGFEWSRWHFSVDEWSAM